MYLQSHCLVHFLAQCESQVPGASGCVLYSGVIDDMEHACYSQWFDYVTGQNPPHLDLIGECGTTTVMHTSYFTRQQLHTIKTQ